MENKDHFFALFSLSITAVVFTSIWLNYTQISYLKGRVTNLEEKLDKCTCLNKVTQLVDQEEMKYKTTKPSPIKPHTNYEETQLLEEWKETSRIKRQQPRKVRQLGTIDQIITLVVQQQLKAALQCQENDTIGSECTLKPGPKGAKGDTGVSGGKGDKGDMGRIGSTGQKGEKGQLGYPGYKGCKGEVGETGVKGLKGDTGEVGPPGTRGMKGDFGGPKGDMGPPGPPGLQGDRGGPGYPGFKGHKGEKGMFGTKGDIGSKGHKGVQGEKGDTNSGTTYIRWGHDDCPSGTGVAYAGRAAGTKWDSKGGTNEYLCLPNNPRYRTTHTHEYAPLYGVEYRGPIIFSSNPRPQTFENMPCAVCYVSTRSAMFIQQASYECPTGWTREYEGYLMGEDTFSNRLSPRSTICVDRYAKALPGTSRRTKTAITFPISVKCPTSESELPCSPYINARILSCAVCTR